MSILCGHKKRKWDGGAEVDFNKVGESNFLVLRHIFLIAALLSI
jgi:hypothetical protein